VHLVALPVFALPANKDIFFLPITYAFRAALQDFIMNLSLEPAGTAHMTVTPAATGTSAMNAAVMTSGY